MAALENRENSSPSYMHVFPGTQQPHPWLWVHVCTPAWIRRAQRLACNSPATQQWERPMRKHRWAVSKQKAHAQKALTGSWAESALKDSPSVMFWWWWGMGRLGTWQLSHRQHPHPACSTTGMQSLSLLLWVLFPWPLLGGWLSCSLCRTGATLAVPAAPELSSKEI